MLRITITILFGFFFCRPAFGQIQNFRFNHITTEHGLSTNLVLACGQDKDGFLWFGTPSGLQRFDGYELKTYHKTAHYGRSPIFEDDNGSLWMICEGGQVYRLDLATEKFRSYPNLGDRTYNLLKNEDGEIWAVTKGFGLARYVHKADTFITYKNDPQDTTSISSDWVGVLFKDSKNNIWVGTDKGLNLFDTKNGQFIRFSNGPKSTILDIKEDKTGVLWIGTTGGLFEFNFPQKSFSHFNMKNLKYIEFIYIDTKNKIWMVTNHGVSSFDRSKSKFITYPNYLKFTNAHPSWSLNPILETKDGSIWSIAHLSLSLFDPSINDFVFFHSDPTNIYSVNDNLFSMIFEDKRNNLWIGTKGGGINYITQSRKDFLFFPLKLVTSLFMDKSGILWIGTQSGILKRIVRNGSVEYKKIGGIDQTVTHITEDNTGFLWIAAFKDILRINKDTEEITLYPLGYSEQILVDRKDRIWLGTSHPTEHKDITWIGTRDNTDKIIFSPIYNMQSGFLYEDRSSNIWIITKRRMVIFNSDLLEPIYDESTPTIKSVYQDSEGNIWAVSFGNKIFTLSESAGILNDFTPAKNLVEGKIVQIIAKNKESLWLLTWRGIAKYNLNTGSVVNYSNADGILTPTSLFFPHCRGNKGEIYLGGNEGYIMFHPDSIKDLPNPPPPIVLTDFKINNKSVEISDSSYLNINVNDIEIIELPHHENIFSIEFSALDYTAPNNNKYAYKLEGFNENWVYTDANNRLASYTNLDPGDYLFSVKGTNYDGVWNETGASLRIIIFPPWWETWWAYTIYSFLFFFIFVFSTRIYFNRQRLKHQLKMEHEHAEKLSHIDQIKTRFFTNISHEFRTPLTLIKGPAKQIIEYSKNNSVIDKANLIHRNAEKLNKLVAQLLDLSKIEAGEMNLHATLTDINSILNNLILSFAPLAEKRKITLTFNPDEQELKLYLDINKFEKIINNILSNAFKFTADHGKIIVSVTKNEQYVGIKISDTGIGIPPNKISKIFNRYYQVDGGDTREKEGTGIGLALTKELVELHHSKITVESVEGEGTTFSIYFPRGKNHLKPEEINDNEVKIDESESAENSKLLICSDSNIEINESELSNKVVDPEYSLSACEEEQILLVEDNKDVRNYIKGFLDSKYKMIEAVDGEEGLSKSLEFIPDLIVSDVMMPKMDGFTLCEKLKRDERTSHIPVILLTAKATKDDRIEGLEIGADDYVSKPFDEMELKVRIGNLIEQRKKLREHFLKESIFNLDNKNISSIDKKFLEKSIRIIHNNISNTSFGVEAFAEELGIGRTTLHKKIVSLVGESPSELIKRIRLSKGAILLKNNYGNISEIALEVGFNNPAYFSECFKKQFSISPSQYQINS